MLLGGSDTYSHLLKMGGGIPMNAIKFFSLKGVEYTVPSAADGAFFGSAPKELLEEVKMFRLSIMERGGMFEYSILENKIEFSGWSPEVLEIV